MWKARHEREREIERLSRNNPHYAYVYYQQYQGPDGYEALVKKLSNELKT